MRFVAAHARLIIDCPLAEVKKTKKKIDFGEFEETPKTDEPVAASKPEEEPISTPVPVEETPAAVDPVAPLDKDADMTLKETDELDFADLVRSSKLAAGLTDATPRN